MTKNWLTVSGLMVYAACSVANAQPGTLSLVRLDIAPQPLDQAITAWAAQTGYQVLIPSGQQASDYVAPLVKGSYTPEGALRVLLGSSDLGYRFVNERTVAIRVADRSGAGSPVSGGSRFMDAQSDTGGSRGAAEEQLTEVVVTAQKRQERLIDTPQSVSVVSTEALAKLGATQFRDYADTIPGMSFTTQGAGYTSVTLRGVTVGSDLGATVAIYVDDVPYTSSSAFSVSYAFALDSALSDINQIEVLRGPQGTLYGASTMGGLIKYVSKQPDTKRFSLETQTGIADTRDGGVSFNVSGAVNVPMASGKAAMRASAFESRDGGYVDNLALGQTNVNRSDMYGGRVDMLFTPTDALTMRVNAFGQNIARDGKANVDYTTAGSPRYGEFGQFRAFEEPFDQHFRLTSAAIGYDFGPATLTSISSYQSVESQYAFDASAGYVPLLARLGRSYSAVGGATRVATNRIVQEIRLASNERQTVEWLFGLYYTHDNSTNDQRFVLRDQAGQPAVNDLFTYSNPTRYEEYAGFGDLTWRLTEKLDVSGGVRYSRNEQVFTQIGSGLLGRSLPTRTASDNATTYLANARYHFNDHATGYVRYATGFRPGGPNIFTINATTGQPNGATTFDADSLKSYEIGVKGETSDRRFGFDVATYYIDWNDIQLTAIRGGFGTLLNAPGGATIKGGELTLSARSTSGFSAAAAFAFQDATLSEANADVGGAKGERLPTVPKFTGTLSGDYELPVGTLRPTIGATVRYVGERPASFNGNLSNPQYILPDYTTVDLHSSFAVDRVNLQFYVRNLFDERGELSELFQFGATRVALIQPRTYGVNARFDFVR